MKKKHPRKVDPGDNCYDACAICTYSMEMAKANEKIKDLLDTARYIAKEVQEGESLVDWMKRIKKEREELVRLRTENSDLHFKLDNIRCKRTMRDLL